MQVAHLEHRTEQLVADSAALAGLVDVYVQDAQGLDLAHSVLVVDEQFFRADLDVAVYFPLAACTRKLEFGQQANAEHRRTCSRCRAEYQKYASGPLK